jgi:hypothetical protein
MMPLNEGKMQNKTKAMPDAELLLTQDMSWKFHLAD